MSRVSQAQAAKWREVTSKPYAEQCKWFLNGFWDEINPDAETIWGFCAKFSELDQEKKASGNELDEFWSHKFLETLGETLTVISLREKLREIDVDNNKKMSISEYLMFRYKKTVDQFINAPQGGNKEELAKAQSMVDAAQKSVSEMVTKLDEQKAAVKVAQEATARSKAAEEESKRSAEAAEKAAAAARAAANEAQAALAELKKQEDAYEKRKEDLVKASQTGGVVQRNKAANELDQLKAEDPLPLRRAKISQTAAVKKAEKTAGDAATAAAAAADAATRAAAAAKDADARQADAEEAEKKVAGAVVLAEKSLEAAVQFLASVKAKGGVARGNIWWMERELTEKKKYLPKKRQ
eukprot:TRINITY_DN4689_c0_g1_i1.p1 TRINITY_DN4689_c0_g1~~TRINITY_DN4689_c0_g1_i1.p1  ORF type:complete len:353 (+),score=136.30 TRINITY_DN4689_c0_g1_i1:87-1145(+)